MGAQSYDITMTAITAAGNLGTEVCKAFDNHYQRPHDERMATIKALSDNGADVARLGIELGGAAVQTAGAVIKTTAETISNVVTGAYNLIDAQFERAYQVKLQKIQKDLAEMKMKHREEMQKEANRHEEFVISEQRKLLEKMIDAATTAYTRKIDFYHAQLESIQMAYSQEQTLLADHISDLEQQRMGCYDDAQKYMVLSQQIDKLEESKVKLNKEYVKAQGSLTDAIRYLEVDKAFTTPLPQNSQLFLSK